MRPGLAILLWMAMASVGALAQAHQHTAGSTGDGQFNPSLAADGRGGFYLVYVERKEGASNVWLRHSKDGAQFAAPVRVNDRDGDATVRNENPPKIAVGTRNEVYVCWANERGRWKGNIRFARSTDGGRSFAPALTLNSDGGGEPAGHAFQSLAVDKRGRVYVAWIDEREKRKQDRGAQIWLSISADGGRTFSPDRRIISDVCECCRTSLTIDAGGAIYLSYRTVPPEGPMHRDVVVARSTDGGRRFQPVIVSRDGWEVAGCPVAGPGLSIDGAGRLTVVWFVGGGDHAGLYTADSTDRGKSYSTRKRLEPQPRMGKHTQTAALGGGRIFVVWDEAAEKTFSVWGVLDAGEGRVSRRSDDREGIAYPVVAVNERIAVIAGMKMGTHEIAIYTAGLKADD